MRYKWKPSASQKKAFAERMKNPDEESAYKERKLRRQEIRRAGSKYDYPSAGGQYIPTENQYKEAWKFLNKGNLTQEQETACNMILTGYTTQELTHHDYIHVVNGMSRKLLTD